MRRCKSEHSHYCVGPRVLVFAESMPRCSPSVSSVFGMSSHSLSRESANAEFMRCLAVNVNFPVFVDLAKNETLAATQLREEYVLINVTQVFKNI